MLKKTFYIFTISLIGLLITCSVSCSSRRQTQDSMFSKRGDVNKKGVNTYMINKKKAPSVQMAEEAAKDAPKSAKKNAKKLKRRREKRARKADRKRRKHNKKVHVRHKLHKSGGDKDKHKDNENKQDTKNAGS